jgi:inosine/xanthosine triphosphate pyrophosphatase family protein
MVFSSSNKMKIEEYRKYLPNLEIVQGRDLREVQGDIDEVIIHKAIDAGNNFLVEDSIIYINDEEVVDIKWRLKDIKEGDRIRWVVSLGYNDGKHINIYRGEISGIGVIPENRKEVIHFDPYFLPEALINPKDDLEYNLKGATLQVLNEMGLKQYYSARAKAAKALKENDIYKFALIKDIQPWKGKYQNE